MQRSIFLPIVTTLALVGCGPGSPDPAIVLEKRLKTGDTSALQELDDRAPHDPWSALALGRAHHLGISTEVDPANAMYAYAFAQKLPEAWFNASLVYSQFLFPGLPPESSEEPDNACFKPSSKSPAMKAIDCLTHAAQSPHPIEARISLARIYQTGHQDVAANPALACHWYGKAADEHDNEGRYHYARCLLSGAAIPRNTSKGAHLMMQAAKHYHPEAVDEMTRLFLRGADRKKAAFWMLLRAEVIPATKRETDRFMATLPHDEIMAARAELKSWKLAHPEPTHLSTRFTSVLPISASYAKTGIH